MTHTRSHSPATDSRAELTDIVELALREARTQGATAAEADVSLSQGMSVTVRLGEVETIEHTRDKELAVTVYVGQHTGSASTADLSPAAVRDCVRAALTIARYTAEDDCAGLADPALLAREILDLDLYHPWHPGTDRAIDIARECEDAARAYDKRIRNSEGASLATHEGIDVYGNSNGFLGVVPRTRYSLSCSVVAQDDSGMQRDYWFTTGRSADSMSPPAEVGREAARRSVRRLGARPITTRRTAVLYEAPEAGSLLSHFVGAVRGSNLYRESSFLLGALGQPVFAPHIRLHEMPHLARGLGSTAFDGEGVATRARDLVRDGVLQGYVLDSYSARKLGMVTTGNAGGVHNLTLEPGEHDLDGLIRQMGTGLLLTELIGFGVNAVTGDYSRGAAGFWVENGEIAYPVDEITIAGNLRDMYRRIVAVGRDIDDRGNLRTGSILIEGLTLAGQ